MAAASTSSSVSPLAPGMQVLLAGVSNCCGAIVTNPVDVLKVRQQLAGELAMQSQQVAAHVPAYRLVDLIQREGILALYKGLLPSLMRESSYSAMRLGLYEPFKDVLGATDPLAPLPLKLAAAACSGCIGSAIASPTDLIKIRIQAFSAAASRELRIRDVITTVYWHEGGFKGFWQGVGPNVLRAALLTASQVSSYDEVKNRIKHAGAQWQRTRSPEVERVPMSVAGGMQGVSGSDADAPAPTWMAALTREGMPLHCVSAMTAGLIAAVVTSPVDTAKTRIMNQLSRGATQPPLYTGMLDCLVKTWRVEGVGGLYKGFWQQWLRIGPHTIVTFMVFEVLRAHIGMRPI